MADWVFLTSHAQVLLCVARESDTRLRHIAECVGITERATRRIIAHLVEAGSPGIGSVGAATTRATSICLSATPSKPTIEWATSSNRCCARAVRPGRRRQGISVRRTGGGDVSEPVDVARLVHCRRCH